MKTIITCILGFALLTGCSKESGTVKLNKPPLDIPATDTVSYLALGDSYTIGQSVAQSSSFPYQLQKSLRQEGIVIKDLKIIAQTGWTTDELKTAIANENLIRKFDVVTLLIGVNNQFRGYSQEVYRKEFIELLQTAINYARGDTTKVFVLSIPDWGATPYGGSGKNVEISKQIDQFNLINKEESIKLNVRYIDITPISRQAAGDILLVAPDGLHPSGNMYALWVEELMLKLKKVFNPG